MSNEILLGIYEKAFPTSFGWEERCRIASRIGYDFIELSVDESDERLERLDWNDFDCENLRRMQNTYNIKISTMCLSALRRYPMGSSDPAISNQGLTTLVKYRRND